MLSFSSLSSQERVNICESCIVSAPEMAAQGESTLFRHDEEAVRIHSIHKK